MKDPYNVLGLSYDATDDEIKKAYRDLVHKYHPDNYVNNPLAELAQEKMKEINEAYDTIIRDRTGNSFGSGNGRSYQTTYERSNSTYQYAKRNSSLDDIRGAINSGDLSRAEMLLSSVKNRDAEWNFLMGSLNYRKGWFDQAHRFFRTAVAMDNTNPEYRQALNYMDQSAASPRAANRSSDIDVCKICSNLMVADCCCEMMGGDLIRCI